MPHGGALGARMGNMIDEECACGPQSRVRFRVLQVAGSLVPRADRFPGALPDSNLD